MHQQNQKYKSATGMVLNYLDPSFKTGTELKRSVQTNFPVIKTVSAKHHISLLELQGGLSNPEHLEPIYSEAFPLRAKLGGKELVLAIDEVSESLTHKGWQNSQRYSENGLLTSALNLIKKTNMSTRARQKIITMIVFCLYLLAIFLTPLLSSTN